MYCLVYAQSSLCTVALIFYTCIWLPLVQLRAAVLTTFFWFGVYRPRDPEPAHHQLQLPVARFCDVCRFGGEEDNNGEDEEDVVCSICLAEMEEEDVVSKLSRCGHVFHWDCIEGWVDRGQFTCPLCRSSIFNNLCSSKSGDL